MGEEIGPAIDWEVIFATEVAQAEISSMQSDTKPRSRSRAIDEVKVGRTPAVESGTTALVEVAVRPA